MNVCNQKKKDDSNKVGNRLWHGTLERETGKEEVSERQYAPSIPLYKHITILSSERGNDELVAPLHQDVEGPAHQHHQQQY